MRMIVLFFALIPAMVQSAGQENRQCSSVCASCIRAHEEFLASDALQGRGSGTHNELVAATYVAAQLRADGIEPTGDDGTYIQKAAVVRRRMSAAPEFMVIPPQGASIALTYGEDFRVLYLSDAAFAASLHKFEAGSSSAKILPDTAILFTGKDPRTVRKSAFAAASGAAAVLVPTLPDSAESIELARKELPKLGPLVEGVPSAEVHHGNVFEFSPRAWQRLQEAPDGSVLKFQGTVVEEKTPTWNAIGILRGSDPKLQHAAILLSAHLDHLGIGPPVNGDEIYNGADDDASGVTAVLELARVLGCGQRPKRTVVFALFGSEEEGILGARYFRAHAPLPLADFALNLEFEMIGRADPAVKSDTLWLTGWERSDLGPILATHGARLVADPHPEQNFFARSDNYVLAKRGLVAQTISSYGLHHDYHRPSDDVAHLNFEHMNAAIGSLIEPMLWLVNSDFVPNWNSGGKP